MAEQKFGIMDYVLPWRRKKVAEAIVGTVNGRGRLEVRNGNDVRYRTNQDRTARDTVKNKYARNLDSVEEDAKKHQKSVDALQDKIFEGRIEEDTERDIGGVSQRYDKQNNEWVDYVTNDKGERRDISAKEAEIRRQAYAAESKKAEQSVLKQEEKPSHSPIPYPKRKLDSDMAQLDTELERRVSLMSLDLLEKNNTPEALGKALKDDSLSKKAYQAALDSAKKLKLGFVSGGEEIVQNRILKSVNTCVSPLTAADASKEDFNHFKKELKKDALYLEGTTYKPRSRITDEDIGKKEEQSSSADVSSKLPSSVVSAAVASKIDR